MSHLLTPTGEPPRASRETAPLRLVPPGSTPALARELRRVSGELARARSDLAETRADLDKARAESSRAQQTLQEVLVMLPTCLSCGGSHEDGEARLRALRSLLAERGVFTAHTECSPCFDRALGAFEGLEELGELDGFEPEPSERRSPAGVGVAGG